MQNMQQIQQPELTVQEVQERANRVIQNLSSKLASIEVVNTNLVVEIDLMTADLQAAYQEIARLQSLVNLDPEDEIQG